MRNIDHDLETFFDECIRLEQNAVRLPSPDLPIIIYGAGSFARDLFEALIRHGFQVAGFLETQQTKTSFSGLPVWSLKDLPFEVTDAQLLLGIFNREVPLQNILELASNAGFHNIFMPWDYFGILSKTLGWRYWLSDRKTITGNSQDICNAYYSLDDAHSREIFLRILKFRLGLDTRFSSYQDSEKQYFNQLTLPALRQKQDLVYVDCGAYDGDSFLNLCKKNTVRHAYLFEPDPNNFANLCGNIRQLDFSCTCLPLAVSDKLESLTFHSGVGESGSISADGNISVQACALDDLIHGEIDFVKIDVEGGEAAAINGAAKLINRFKPTLAISLYHLPKDLWELPLLIKSFNKQYKLFIRQHWFNSFDCVLYAIHVS